MTLSWVDNDMAHRLDHVVDAEHYVVVTEHYVVIGEYYVTDVEPVRDGRRALRRQRLGMTSSRRRAMYEPDSTTYWSAVAIYWSARDDMEARG
jgi:hypothetical protein